MKEPRGGNVPQIAGPFILIGKSLLFGCKLDIWLAKSTNEEGLPDEFSQRGLPGILEASNSSAP